jgi:hypothetical protein
MSWPTPRIVLQAERRQPVRASRMAVRIIGWISGRWVRP